MDIPISSISKILGGTTASKPTEDHAVHDAADTVTTETQPAVEHTHVKKQHEEKVQHVVEKETHQDHYHTTVQPLKAKEVELEEHKYKQAETQERSFNHEDAAGTEAKLKSQKAQFENKLDTAATQKTKTVEPNATSDEHIHHHLHETIQPVIEKEIVKPSVTHTKVPIHETHQEASVVHGVSTAEPMSVEEFEKTGNKVDKHT